MVIGKDNISREEHNKKIGIPNSKKEEIDEHIAYYVKGVTEGKLDESTFCDYSGNNFGGNTIVLSYKSFRKAIDIMDSNKEEHNIERIERGRRFRPDSYYIKFKDGRIKHLRYMGKPYAGAP